jgi:AraC-like DNA-binding protein
LKPALCIVVQGAKWTTFGGKRLDYRAGQALVVNVEMPLFGTVAASPKERYLGIVLEFNLATMQEVIHGLNMHPGSDNSVNGAGMFVTDLTGALTECALRSLRLFETPKAIPILYPGIMREICYCVLTGPSGGQIIRMAMAHGHEQRVVKGIHSLRDRFAESVRIEELPSIAKLSPSAFHRQFKALTSMTPLQYQKQRRLLETRRLMVSDAANVETAAFEVGYESPSQFSREYARMFGLPPARHTGSATRRCLTFRAPVQGRTTEGNRRRENSSEYRGLLDLTPGRSGPLGTVQHEEISTLERLPSAHRTFKT